MTQIARYRAPMHCGGAGREPTELLPGRNRIEKIGKLAVVPLFGREWQCMNLKPPGGRYSGPVSTQRVILGLL